MEAGEGGEVQLSHHHLRVIDRYSRSSIKTFRFLNRFSQTFTHFFISGRLYICQTCKNFHKLEIICRKRGESLKYKFEKSVDMYFRDKQLLCVEEVSVFLVQTSLPGSRY